jgi:glucokinase
MRWRVSPLSKRHWRNYSLTGERDVRLILTSPKVCLAVAADPHQHEISFTNNPWRFTQAQVAAQTGCSDIQIVNDFAAVARSLPAITASDLEQIGDGASQLGRPMVTIGPGTGCGVATLVFDDAGKAMVLPGRRGGMWISRPPRIMK